MGMVRLALAMAVLLGHLPIASFKFMGAGLAVQGFFVVSGFYMALVLDGKYRDAGLFYSNRLLRLAPTYFVMMAIAAVALFGFGITATATPELFQAAYANPFTAIVMMFENIFVVGQEMLYWFRIGDDGALSFDLTGNGLPTETSAVGWQALLVPQSWSLSMELMFYALAPFLARLSWRWLAAIAVSSIALRFAGNLLPVDYGLWQGRFFPTALFLFVFGMLGYRLLPLARRAPKFIGWLLALATLALIIGLPRLQLPSEQGRWLVYIALALTTPFVFNAFKDNALDRWIGDLSYPMYLCHLVIVAWVLIYQPPFAAWVAIGVTLALSALLLVLVEHPVDRWRQRRAGAARETAAALGAATVTPLST
jgi:peptidoglycan/LPS O-acetylase OafA/YrhL